MMDYYKILELPKSANATDIKKAYRRLSKKYHPDINPNGTEYFKLIAEAYRTLSDSSKRELYDLRQNRPKQVFQQNSSYQEPYQQPYEPHYNPTHYPPENSKKALKSFLIFSTVLLVIISLVFILFLPMHYRAQEERNRVISNQASEMEHSQEFINGVFKNQEHKIYNQITLKSIVDKLKFSNTKVEFSFNFDETVGETELGLRINQLNTFLIERGVEQGRISYKWDQKMVESNRLKVDYYWIE